MASMKGGGVDYQISGGYFARNINNSCCCWNYNFNPCNDASINHDGTLWDPKPPVTTSDVVDLTNESNIVLFTEPGPGFGVICIWPILGIPFLLVCWGAVCPCLTVRNIIFGLFIHQNNGKVRCDYYQKGPWEELPTQSFIDVVHVSLAENYSFVASHVVYTGKEQIPERIPAHCDITDVLHIYYRTENGEIQSFSKEMARKRSVNFEGECCCFPAKRDANPRKPTVSVYKAYVDAANKMINQVYPEPVQLPPHLVRQNASQEYRYHDPNTPETNISINVSNGHHTINPTGSVSAAPMSANSSVGTKGYVEMQPQVMERDATPVVQGVLVQERVSPKNIKSNKYDNKNDHHYPPV